MSTPQRMGRYVVLSRLAVGGMAEVFLAWDTQTQPGRLVTLKRILPELCAQEEFVRMFNDEARISASLAHPNIARMYELGQADGEPFIALEYLPGESLHALLRSARHLGRPLPLGFSARLGVELCRALHFAHQFRPDDSQTAGIIHRDVSPRNVMVTYDGRVKVIDFGVAKAKGSLSRTGTGNIKGSHGYMSPEQARGALLDARSDVFSAGVVLHELLTGRPLFLRDSELLTFRGILRDEVPTPMAVNPGVPRALSDAVMGALARVPSARYPSAQAMAAALSHAVPSLVFDEPRMAHFLGELFPERLASTRALLELARQGADLERLVQAAEELRDTSPRGPTTTSPVEHTSVYGRSSVPEVDSRTRPRVQVKYEPVVEGAIVLSVDDSEISRQFVEAHLEGAGFPVLQAASADEALALVERQLPDLILLDVRMPGVDGYELCQRLRVACRRRPFLPILFLSSATSFEERLEGLAAGGDDFLRKPYVPDELVGLVRAHLRRAAFLQLVSERSAGN